jgi:4-amino-4-deoxy-L-arabinose transferase-like glycosyltransferase
MRLLHTVADWLDGAWARVEGVLLTTAAPPFLPLRQLGWQERFLRAERASLGWLLVAPLIVVAVAVYHYRMLIHWSTQTPFDFDAIATYLPMAKQFLAEGPRFLLTERAVNVPPFSFLFPALFGGEATIQRQVNMGLSVLVILLLFRTGFVMHSRLAGVLAAAAYACSPHFWPYMSTASVEAIYIFLMVAAVWALAEGERGARWGFITAGVLLGLATMTRATILYFLPLATVAGWWLARRANAQAPFWRGVRNASLIALAMVAPLIAKNLYLWGVSAVSTGAGVALLNGHHPLTWGMESNYYNFNSDHGVGAAHLMTHLDVKANASMAALGRYIMAEMPLAMLAKMYAIKTAAFLFVTNREWVMPVELLRGWRVVLLGVAMLSLFAIRRHAVLAFIWALFAFQIVIHVPALYSHRYSVSAVDLSLAWLAAIGAAYALFHLRIWLLPLWVGLVFWAWSLVPATAANPHFPMPNVYGVPHGVVARYGIQDLPIASHDGFVRDEHSRWVQHADKASLEVDFTSLKDLTVEFSVALAFDIRWVRANHPAACDTVKFEYRGQNQASYASDRIWHARWRAVGAEPTQATRYIVGAGTQIRVNEPGVLRMTFQCPGATLAIDKLEVLQMKTIATYAKAYLAREGLKNWREWYPRHGFDRGRE